MTSLHRRQAGSEAASTPVRVLIAEDDPDYRTYLVALTRRLGLIAETANDGTEALEKLQADHFDLLISDYEMPRYDGLELIRTIRATDGLNGLYAVMLTAHDDVPLKIEALTAGYDDFLQKTCTEVEMMAKVTAARRMLSRQRALAHAAHEWQGIASHDELTGVFTRRFFFAEAERSLAEGRAIGVVLFDLDDFKRINDTYGHLTGDRILRDIGALLVSRTRHGDVIARFGGDEFVLLVINLPLDGMRVVANRIAEDMHELQWTVGEVTLNVHATTGVGSSTLLPNATMDQILEVADRDLYANKWLAKNTNATAEELYRYQQERAADIVRLKEEAPDADAPPAKPAPRAEG